MDCRDPMVSILSNKAESKKERKSFELPENSPGLSLKLGKKKEKENKTNKRSFFSSSNVMYIPMRKIKIFFQASLFFLLGNIK